MYLLKSYGIYSKLVRDPIYNFIEIPDEFKPIIDNKLFQRLRWISQLPLEQLVYPSAQHSRFEHSLGVMHLSMLSAISLVNNSQVEIKKAFNKDIDFKGLTQKEKVKNFILAAGLAGLLHDLGHAPFSHTLEDACKYSSIKYKYDHEEVGYILATELLKEISLTHKVYSKKTLQVLNKKLKLLNKDLTPIDMIIRKLIDGPIDVDKGDYIIRDSYHCGTTYGIYDIQRLWRNIVINPNDFTIAVNHKGALEAWTLRFQRYKMYKNVYKHHIRNITDAMLIDIIATSLDKIKRSNKKLDLIPIKSIIDELHTSDCLSHFVFWTDNSILREISRLNIPIINNRIEAFLKRYLYKRGPEIDLSKFPEALAKATNKEDMSLRLKLRELKNKLHISKNLDFDFLIEKVIIPPVYENDVQLNIKVLQKDGTFITLAKYLDIDSVQNKEEYIQPNEKNFVYLYIDEPCLANSKIIEEEVVKILSEFSDLNVLNDVIT